MPEVIENRVVDIPIRGLHEKRQMWDVEHDLNRLILSLEANENLAQRIAEREQKVMDNRDIASYAYTEASAKKFEAEFNAAIYAELKVQAIETKRKLIAALGNEH